MQLFARIALAVCSVAISAGCSGAGRAITSALPQTPNVVSGSPAHHVDGRKLGLISNGGRFHSFSEAVGVVLGPKDYDNFIDPSITGADRQRALELMKSMPANKRGDFVLVEGGRVTSNRPELALKVHRKTPQELRALPHPAVMMSGQRATLAYPPTGGGGGPYIRTYGKQGAMGGLAYATIPCNNNLEGGDHGFMYFNAYSGSSSGSIIDSGLEVYNDYKVHPFIISRDSPNGLFSGWTNEAGHDYTCTANAPNRRPLGILFGISPNGQSVLVIGVPDYDPYVYNLPPTQSRWTNATWNFSSPPSGLFSPGNWQGLWTPCTTCSIARMFTIAANSSSRSCFGACNGQLTGRWDQTVMGELISPCSSSQAQCTIAYPTDVTQWYGGENDSGRGIFLSGYDYDHGLEGINLAYGGRSVVSTAAGTFNSPLRDISVPCTPDSYRACGYYTNIVTNQCDSSDPNSPIYATSWMYHGYSDVTGVASDFYATADTPAYAPCTSFQVNWGSQDPRSYFSDPNLPGPNDMTTT